MPPSPADARTRRATWLAAAAFVTIATVLAARTAGKLPGQQSAGALPAWAMTDFRDTVYYPAVAFLAGRDPYDPSFAREYPVQRSLPPYGPVILLVHLPLAALPEGPAAVAYFLTSLVLTLAVAALALRGAALPSTPAAVLAAGALMLVSRPGHQNLVLGQSTLEVVLGAYLALVFTRERPLLAALGLALATMKPQFAAPLAVLLVVAGEGRVVAVGLAIAGVISLATLLAHGGPAALVSWRHALAISSASAAHPSRMWYLRMDAGYLVDRVLGGGALGELVASVLALALGALVVRRARVPGAPLAASPIAVTAACVTILICAYHLAYDALLLTLPILALARAARDRALSPAVAAPLLTLLLVPAINYVATEALIHRLGVRDRWWLAVTAANGVALATAVLVCAASTFSRRRRRPTAAP